MEVISNKLKTNILTCPGSKSHANRLLFLAALQKGEILIENLPQAQDVQLFIKALKELNFPIKEKGNSIHVGEFKADELSRDPVYLGEGGTTIRFMLVLLASIGGHFQLRVEERFLKRPIDDFIELMEELGVIINIQKDIITLDGKILTDRSIDIDCEITTQFASAFIMLKKLNLIKEVELYNLQSSHKYIELTESIDLSDHYQVKADFSSLTYLLTWGVLREELLIENIHDVDTTQADSIYIEYLQQLGAKISFTEKGLRVIPSSLKGKLDIDASLSLDLIPTLIVLSLGANIELNIKNYKNLIFKESDRLKEIIKCLDQFQCEYEKSQDSLKVYPPVKSKNKMSINCAYDHRIVMMNYLLLKLFSGGDVRPIKAIEKSFPEFIQIFN